MLGVAALGALLGLVAEIYRWLQILHDDIIRGELAARQYDAISWGFFIFLFTEIILFAACFATFVHFAISPATAFFLTFPPVGLVTIFAFGLPLSNLFILVYSSCPLQCANELYLRVGRSTWFGFGLPQLSGFAWGIIVLSIGAALYYSTGTLPCPVKVADMASQIHPEVKPRTLIELKDYRGIIDLAPDGFGDYRLEDDLISRKHTPGYDHKLQCITAEEREAYLAQKWTDDYHSRLIDPEYDDHFNRKGEKTNEQ